VIIVMSLLNSIKYEKFLDELFKKDSAPCRKQVCRFCSLLGYVITLFQLQKLYSVK
jgi:hypothetical protein